MGCCFFFFFKQKTAYEMRISDWSSDVCSSDLTFPSVADDRIGSRLWLLRRVKLTRQTQLDAEFYARQALQWLIDDGHCSAIDIISERLDAQRLNLRTVLTLADGERLDINPDNRDRKSTRLNSSH